MSLTPEEQKKQERYRDARFTKQYDGIWKSVGKCVFCDLREKYIFFEEHGIVMTVSLYAYIDGHFMITPRRHIRSPKELTQTEWDTIRKFFYIAKKLIREVHGVKGMQIVQKDGSDAQSTVDQHLHFHCIPFDAPDLCGWNYRELKHTPLENAELYRKQRKKIASLDQKYRQKYTNPTKIRVVCDVIMLTKDNQVLMQERIEELKLTPDYMTLPGGGVENFNLTLQDELIREVKEETGLDISGKKLRLLDSRIGETNTTRRELHINASYEISNQFLWNTYLMEDRLPNDIKVTPGDDCSALVWMDLEQATTHDRISAPIRQILIKALKELN